MYAVRVDVSSIGENWTSMLTWSALSVKEEQLSTLASRKVSANPGWLMPSSKVGVSPLVQMHDGSPSSSPLLRPSQSLRGRRHGGENRE